MHALNVVVVIVVFDANIIQEVKVYLWYQKERKKKTRRKSEKKGTQTKTTKIRDPAN